mmetsp:Transcript_16778/g.49230  ORF Transcript_16778/g.49230 Transcript_16778/m.49230 type:complete len:370 (+) Transcript_16778:68-1177(+)
MLSGVVLLYASHAVVRVALAPARATATARHASVHAQSEPAAAAREPIAYYRDPDDAYFEKLAKLPPVDEAAVDALVAERSRLRAAFEYDAADAVKAQILALGVTVVDVRGQEAWYVTPRHSRTLEAAEAAEVEEGRAASASPRRKGGRDLGPRGHDFERTGGGAKGKAGQVSLGEVDRRLAARLAAKLRGRYSDADAELEALEALGIRVCDATKRWRADGEAFGSGYERTVGDGDEDVPALDTAPIEQLLLARARAKQARDFGKADALRGELRAAHSVIVDDQRRAWRRVRLYGDYYRVGPRVGKAEPKIGKLLTTLSQAASGERAALLEELGAMGVQVDEGRGTWRRPRRTPEELAAAAALRGEAESK